jgi:hypothetical protein
MRSLLIHVNSCLFIATVNLNCKFSHVVSRKNSKFAFCRHHDEHYRGEHRVIFPNRRVYHDGCILSPLADLASDCYDGCLNFAMARGSEPKVGGGAAGI